jgi:hypothetical protein
LTPKKRYPIDYSLKAKAERETLKILKQFKQVPSSLSSSNKSHAAKRAEGGGGGEIDKSEK